MDETKTETTSASPLHGSRIQPRRSSRSTLASSPTTTTITKEDRHGVLPAPDASTQVSPASPSSSNTGNGETPLNNSTSATSTGGAPTTSAANYQSRVTRSLSADSNSNEESSNTSTTTSTATITNGKRRRHTNNSKASNKKKSGNTATTTNNASMATPSPTPSSSSLNTPAGTNVADDTERETRNTTQRLSKEAKDSRRAEREIIVKRKLSELEVLEEKVKNQSHEGYQTLLEDIQMKRTKKLTVAQGRHALMVSNFKNGFLSQKKSAEDQFYLDKLALRRNMMHQVQQKINKIEQEYFSSLQQGGAKNLLDEPHLNEWTPPDRPSMISSLTLGLDEQQVEQDFAELQDLLPSSTMPPSIEENHLLDSSKKDALPLISST